MQSNTHAGAKILPKSVTSPAQTASSDMNRIIQVKMDKKKQDVSGANRHHVFDCMSAALQHRRSQQQLRCCSLCWSLWLISKRFSSRECRIARIGFWQMDFWQCSRLPSRKSPKQSLLLHRSVTTKKKTFYVSFLWSGEPNQFLLNLLTLLGHENWG